MTIKRIDAPRTQRVTTAAPQPTAKTAKRATVDELSSGKGRALRTAAERVLGARPFSAATALANVKAGVQLKAFGGPVLGPPAPVPADVKQKAEDNLRGVVDGVSLGYRLSQEKDPAVRDEMIRQIVTNDDLRGLLENFGFGGDGSATNQAYDGMTSVSSAVAHAYASGAITSGDLKDLAKSLGPEETAFLVETLSISSDNTGVGGVVDALGQQAKALGYDTAAALAFTSSDALITARLPNSADQKAAFKQLQGFLNEFGEAAKEGMSPLARNAVELALVNGSRLTARGTGFTQQELDDTLKQLGPRVTGEAIARSGQAPGDTGVPGPLDVLGKAAMRAAAADSKHAEDWKVDANIAFTQSPALIAANLNTPELQLAAFESINTYLAKNRDEWSNAANDPFQPYSLLRLPQAVEGINRLLSTHPELLTTLTSTVKGQADLVQLFESISLDPNVPKSERDQLMSTINTYIDTSLKNAGTDASVTADRIGRLLGLIQVAGSRAVSNAKGPEKDEVKALALDFSKEVVSKLAGAALSETGPIGSFLGDYVVGKVLDQIFGGLADKDLSAAEVRKRFLAQLEGQGIDSANGGEIEQQLVNDLAVALDALNAQLAQATSQSDKNKIQAQINLLTQLKLGINGQFDDAVLSGQPGQSVSNELDKRGD
jgi:hypothetical protein